MNLAVLRKRFPPPSRFRPAGEILRSEIAQYAPPFIKQVRRRGRRAEGIRYESKGQAHFLATYPDTYVASPWFRFWPPGAKRWVWCQPDGLLIDIRRGVITVVEFKLKHTSDAWWQVRHLYQPVVRACVGVGWEFSAVEVVRWFDPDVAFPEPIRKAPEPGSLDTDVFGVHIWSGRRRGNR